MFPYIKFWKNSEIADYKESLELNDFNTVLLKRCVEAEDKSTKTLTHLHKIKYILLIMHLIMFITPILKCKWFGEISCRIHKFWLIIITHFIYILICKFHRTIFCNFIRKYNFNESTSYTSPKLHVEKYIISIWINNKTMPSWMQLTSG